MLYYVTNDFFKINETNGTIQNTSSIFSIEVSDKPDVDSGFILFPLNKISFSGEDIYLRCIEAGGRAAINVVSFIHTSSSGQGSSIDDSQIATDEQIDSLLDDVFG